MACYSVVNVFIFDGLKMSREIKFRYYSAPQGKMVEWGDIMKLHVHTVFKMLQPECVLMQFTGLKDKNGVEIYEGDIVSDGNKQSNHCLKGTFEVEFYDGGFSPFCVAGWECTMHQDDCEVIGNIYENPEFLKVTK